MNDRVDEYLADVRAALPGSLRKDVLAEVEDHLRESASSCGAEEAVARFGSAHDLARSLARVVALRDLRRATLLLLLAMLPVGLALWPLPQSLLPAWGASPADRWPQQAVAVAGEQDAILLLVFSSAGLVLAGIAAAARRLLRLALPLYACGLAAVVVLVVIVTSLAWQWGGVLPAAPSRLWIALYAVLETALLTSTARIGARAASHWLGAAPGLLRSGRSLEARRA